MKQKQGVIFGGALLTLLFINILIMIMVQYVNVADKYIAKEFVYYKCIYNDNTFSQSCKLMYKLYKSKNMYNMAAQIIPYKIYICM